MASEFTQVERLIIRGTGFGDEAGDVELFHTVPLSVGSDGQPLPTRTRTITLADDAVRDWTGERIVVVTTPSQRGDFSTDLAVADLDSLDLVPTAEW